MPPHHRRSTTPFLVAVHIGAGWHSPSKEPAYKQLMFEAIAAATSVLQQQDPGSGLDAVVAALRVLEVCVCRGTCTGKRKCLAAAVGTAVGIAVAEV